jgi:hypothetical protein
MHRWVTYFCDVFILFYNTFYFGILLAENIIFILPMGPWFKISNLIMKTYV